MFHVKQLNKIKKNFSYLSSQECSFPPYMLPTPAHPFSFFIFFRGGSGSPQSVARLVEKISLSGHGAQRRARLGNQGAGYQGIRKSGGWPTTGNLLS
jgi:hypothetical protein